MCVKLWKKNLLSEKLIYLSFWTSFNLAIPSKQPKAFVTSLSSCLTVTFAWQNICKQKIEVSNIFLPEILMITESSKCDWNILVHKLYSKIFSDKVLALENSLQYLWGKKVMTIFYGNLKKTLFWTLIEPFSSLLEKPIAFLENPVL